MPLLRETLKERPDFAISVMEKIERFRKDCKESPRLHTREPGPRMRALRSFLNLFLAYRDGEPCMYQSEDTKNLDKLRELLKTRNKPLAPDGLDDDIRTLMQIIAEQRQSELNFWQGL
ncbi:MAG: hypothetical protein PHU71_01510 [Candidatus Gracilibacteria bacterium]|nr:hypothetical protein [Candidatus Gracilibacteria bacterium]